MWNNLFDLFFFSVGEYQWEIIAFLHYRKIINLNTRSDLLVNKPAENSVIISLLCSWIYSRQDFTNVSLWSKDNYFTLNDDKFI